MKYLTYMRREHQYWTTPPRIIASNQVTPHLESSKPHGILANPHHIDPASFKHWYCTTANDPQSAGGMNPNMIAPCRESVVRNAAFRLYPCQFPKSTRTECRFFQGEEPRSPDRLRCRPCRFSEDLERPRIGIKARRAGVQ